MTLIKHLTLSTQSNLRHIRIKCNVQCHAFHSIPYINCKIPNNSANLFLLFKQLFRVLSLKTTVLFCIIDGSILSFYGKIPEEVLVWQWGCPDFVLKLYRAAGDLIQAWCSLSSEQFITDGNKEINVVLQEYLSLC